MQDYSLFIRSNHSVSAIEAAYRQGVAETSVDVEELFGSNNQDPFPSRISVEAFNQIEESSNEVGLAPLIHATPDFFEKVGNFIVVTPGQYFTLWRATAKIGNPELIMSVVEDPTPVISIGGYAAYPEY